MFDGYIEKNEQKTMDDNIKKNNNNIKNTKNNIIENFDNNKIIRKESIWAKSMDFPKDFPLY